MAKKENTNNKIDVIIPAYKAQGTLKRCLASIYMQTIMEDLDVYVVDDATPDGKKDYEKIVKQFSDLGLSIKLITLDVNAGPGVARQKGIEAGSNQFFTCIDADDTFAGALALEGMRAGMTQENPQLPKDSIKCVSATFLQLGEDLSQVLPHQQDMVWMFGKLYRRKFIEDYGIKFNTTRANEDTGYNKWVQLLCSNQNEQIKFLADVVYYWHNKENSITRINDGQYAHDQCFCGWTDNMIYAIENARKKRPFDGTILQAICSIMLELYYYYIEVVAKDPVFAEQDWEYVKKFYNKCYKKIEADITEEALSQMFSIASMGRYSNGSMIGIVPSMGIKEFFNKLQEEEYNEDDIYKVWDKMYADPESKKLMENNITCGVCMYEDFLSKQQENNNVREGE